MLTHGNFMVELAVARRRARRALRGRRRLHTAVPAARARARPHRAGRRGAAAGPARRTPPTSAGWPRTCGRSGRRSCSPCRGSSRSCSTPPASRPPPTAGAGCSTGPSRLPSPTAGAQDRGGPGPLLRARHAVFDRLVYRALRAALGGRCTLRGLRGRPARRAARPLLPRHRRDRAGGLRPDRDHGGVDRQPPGRRQVGTVGRPLGGVGVRVAEDGEIQVRGGQVFAGYWGDPTRHRGGAHRRRLAAHRRPRGGRRRGLRPRHRPQEGDPGHRRGQERRPRRARGRVRRHPLVSQCMVVGDGQPYVARAGHPGRRERRRVGRAAGQARPRHLAWSTTRTCAPRSRRRSTPPTRRSPRPSRSAGSRCCRSDWTEEGGQLTPSLKLRRSVVSREAASRDRGALLAVGTRPV